MSAETPHYILRNGVFSAPKKLIVHSEYINWSNNDPTESSAVRVHVGDFEDVKYKVERIQVDMFSVGLRYFIDIQYDGGKILPIRFAQYYWRMRGYENVYSEVSALIWKYFLSYKVNDQLAKLEIQGFLDMDGIKITRDKIIFQDPYREVYWQNIGLKQYYNYFAIFNIKDPNSHKRITFYAWNAEILYHTIRTLMRDKALAS